MTFEFLRNRDLGATRSTSLLPVLQKLPCSQAVQHLTSTIRMMTPKLALTVASRWEMTKLSLDAMQSMTKFRVPLRIRPKLDPAAIPVIVRAGTNGWKA
jgi:hypothetical protein